MGSRIWMKGGSRASWISHFSWMKRALIICTALSHVSGEYLVCKPIQSFFESNSTSSAVGQTGVGPRGPPGPPGKRGPQGLSGPSGPVGQQPEIDWKVINEIINSRIKENLKCSGFVDGGYCYRLLYTTGLYSVDHGGKQRATNLCVFHGGELVDIDTQQLYNKICKYLQQYWLGWVDKPSRYALYIWLASTFQNNHIVSSTGGNIYENWWPGFPSGSAGGMALEVKMYPSQNRSDTGVFNVATNNPKIVPFCRFTH